MNNCVKCKGTGVREVLDWKNATYALGHTGAGNSKVPGIKKVKCRTCKGTGRTETPERFKK